jgi:hypothetical protein
MNQPSQLGLLAWQPPQAAPKAPEPTPRAEQAENLARVRGRIGPAVFEFCRMVMARGEGLAKPAAWVAHQFHAADVVAFVAKRDVPCAPASVDRILRDLRRGGFVSYSVVKRSASLYCLHWVKEPTP